ncbi:DUF4832 domain-containing protein [Bacteroides sp. OttesenSCG-928-J23]|nr:DUF4832 domain-containing protein [Bacteroides sp. OttesenSCG-928-J23]MDL2304852.1 DUF4832 domain-containing protein [Bacteroides sp. OttesenSCG-928-D19]
MKAYILYLFSLAILLFHACKEEDHGVLPPIEEGSTVQVKDGKVIVNPNECNYAIRNPMKGLREFYGPGYDKVRAQYPYPYGSMIKEYMQWNMIEEDENDGVDKIIAYSNHRWRGVEDINVKVIPRIFIVWIEPWHGGYAKNTYTSHPDDLNGWHWPTDIQPETYNEDINSPITGGYSDPNFQERLRKLIAKAGQAWDNDPRVAYIEMGIIGEWGEHHDPNISTYWAPHDQPNHVENRTWIPGMEKTLGDAFTQAFKNKKVMVRYAYDFKDYNFGIYWDSWAIDEEKVRGYEEMKKLGDRWKTQPIGGEITWNWGSLGRYNSFEEVVANEATRKLVTDQIRELHCNHLGGITWANFDDETFKPNAEILQKTMGYRFVLSNFTYPVAIKKGEAFNVAFDVENTGSSPFYYDWPVEIALLDATTKQKVWSQTLATPKTSQWMPGDGWNNTNRTYDKPAQKYHISEQITLDQAIGAGNYIISIAVLDPAGMLPSLRFAVQNYAQGGRHPMGYIGVDNQPTEHEIPASEFADMRQDKTLKYKLN